VLTLKRTRNAYALAAGGCHLLIASGERQTFFFASAT
jgi:hypothetical protein